MNAMIDHLFPTLDSMDMAGIHAEAASSLLAWLRQWEMRNAAPTAGKANPSAGQGPQRAGAARALRLWQLAQSGVNGYTLFGMEQNDGETEGQAGGIAAAFRKRDNPRQARMRQAMAPSPMPPEDELVRQARLGILEGLSRLLD